jgi:hypothetical protein
LLVVRYGIDFVVIKRVASNLEILDQRFERCILEKKYSIFKEGSPDQIEVQKILIEVGEELEFQLNRETLSKVRVDRK